MSYLPIRLPWSADAALMGVVFMILGYCSYRYQLFERLNNWFIMGFSGIFYIILCIKNPGIAMSVREYGSNGALSILLFGAIGFLGSLLYITVAKIICKQLPALRKILSSIGQRTLTILGFHVFIFLCLDTLLGKVGIGSLEGWTYWIVGIVKMVITLIICILGNTLWTNGRNREKVLRVYHDKRDSELN